MKTEKDKDRELKRRICQKDQKAFEELVELYGGLIKGIVSYHLKNMSMWREDCINDILLKIWLNINKFNTEKSSLKNWIGAVAKYRCIDYKRKYIKELYNEELTCDKAVVTTEASLLEGELSDETEVFLAELKKEDREIFMKRYIEELSIDEISKSAGKTPSYIYSRLSRSRKKLREKFLGKT